MLCTLKFLRVFLSKVATSTTFYTTAVIIYSVIIDLIVCIFSLTVPFSIYELDPRIWHRVEKDLYLYTS
jgi:hypothetical protein